MTTTLRRAQTLKTLERGVQARDDLVTGVEQFTIQGESVVQPSGGFDCDALASQFGQPIAELGSLLATARTEDEFEAISNAQINMADGLQACFEGRHEDAAAYFGAAVYSMEVASE